MATPTAPEKAALTINRSYVLLYLGLAQNAQRRSEKLTSVVFGPTWCDDDELSDACAAGAAILRKQVNAFVRELQAHGALLHFGAPKLEGGAA